MARVEEYEQTGHKDLPVVASGSQIEDNNPSVDDVVSKFSKIRTRGDYLAFWDGDQIRWPRYTANIANTFGLKNHLQGIQRLQNSNYMIVSGGDQHGDGAQGDGPMSHLFIVKMTSRRTTGEWRSNLIADGVPPDGDQIVKTIGIDSNMWHAGGISLLGDILAVPIYGDKDESGKRNSKIVFYSFNEPENPKRFNFEISRSGLQSFTVALAKLPSGFFLLAVWGNNPTQGSNANEKRRIDFYLSKSDDFFEGFTEEKVSWFPSAVLRSDGHEGSFDDFQTINFIKPGDGDGDAESDVVLYLVGLHNNSDVAPTIAGRDYADLYRISFPKNSLQKESPELAVPKITKIMNKQFYCKDRQCNMDSAAGVYLDSSGVINVYSSFHWRSDSLIAFNEYKSGVIATPETISDIKDAWVDLYEHDNFRGRTLRIIGDDERDTKFSDYRRIYVEGSHFNDKISSARFQIPEGVTYRLFEHRDFNGRTYPLEGTGNVVEIPDFKKEQDENGKHFGDRFSSSKYGQ